MIWAKTEQAEALRVCLQWKWHTFVALMTQFFQIFLNHFLQLMCSRCGQVKGAWRDTFSLVLTSFFIHSINSMFLVLFSHILITFYLPLNRCSSTLIMIFMIIPLVLVLTCIKCPSGINLLLVLKPRLFGMISPRLSVTALLPLTLKSAGFRRFMVSLFVNSLSLLQDCMHVSLLNLRFVSCFSFCNLAYSLLFSIK